MMRILVTGSCGQIGTALVAHLRQRYGAASVMATDLLVGTKSAEDGVRRLDACDAYEVERCVVEHNANCVVHLAAILSARAEQNPQNALRINNRGQEAVLEVAKRHRLEVFSPSSIAVHRRRTKHGDNDTASPSTVYGISKLYGEHLGQYYFERHGVDYRSLRIPGVISRRQKQQTLDDDDDDAGGTTDWAFEMFESRHYSCFLKAHTTLPMVYIADLVKGIATFVEAPRSKLTKSVYDIASFSVSPAQLADKIREFETDFSCDYDNISEYRQAIADTWPAALDDSAARKDWGWAPEYDLEATTSATLLQPPRTEQDEDGAFFVSNVSTLPSSASRIRRDIGGGNLFCP